MKYIILFSSGFKKDISKLDKSDYELLRKWIKKHLLSTKDPRSLGKALTGDLKGLWRYRIDNYRMIVEIDDSHFIVLALEYGLINKVYK